ncbi:MAG: ABC transporter ATP-binding protein [Pseudomonadota bacterium]
MSFVQIRDLSKKFGETAVFADIAMTIEQGEVCVLVGPSGCGKTTLLRVMAGLAQPDTGSIRIAGRDVLGLAPHQRGIAMVFQNYALFPNMTVAQNISFALEQQGKRGADLAQRVAAMIDLMELGPRANARPAALSGGQKQRVALARALALEPQLLLLDEPLSALDAQIRKRLQVEFKRLQARIGFTAVFVTHDQEEALILGDRIAVMQSGRILQSGAPHEVYGAPASRAVAGFIGNINILEPQTVRHVFGQTTQDAWALHPETISLSPTPDAAKITAQGEITDRLPLGSTVRYSVLVQDVSLSVDVLSRPSLPPLAMGTRVFVEVNPADVRLLTD